MKIKAHGIGNGRKTKVTARLVREWLDYDPETGLFRYKLPRQRWFASYRSWRSWIGKNAGKPAFTMRLVDKSGAVRLWGCVAGEYHAASRVAFLWMTGRWPREVDHIDGDTTDNRWHMMRDVKTHSVNMRNRRRQRTHAGRPLKQKHEGVRPNGNGWSARLGYQGKTLHLGTFPTEADAVVARREKMRELGFSERHGV